MLHHDCCGYDTEIIFVFEKTAFDTRNAQPLLSSNGDALIPARSQEGKLAKAGGGLSFL